MVAIDALDNHRGVFCAFETMLACRQVAGTVATACAVFRRSEIRGNIDLEEFPNVQALDD